MGILTGRAEGIRVIALADYAFIGTLADYAKGMSTRSLPPTDTYTLEFESYDQLYGDAINNDAPHFHYQQIGCAGHTVDPKTHRLIPAPDVKRPKLGQLYLALLDSPQMIKQLVEITEKDIDSLRQAAAEKKSH